MTDIVKWGPVRRKPWRRAVKEVLCLALLVGVWGYAGLVSVEQLIAQLRPRY